MVTYAKRPAGPDVANYVYSNVTLIINYERIPSSDLFC